MTRNLYLKSKYKDFSDKELYMLKRHAIESAFHIMMEGEYTKEEQKIHVLLLSEAINEIRERTDSL